MSEEQENFTFDDGAPVAEAPQEPIQQEAAPETPVETPQEPVEGQKESKKVEFDAEQQEIFNAALAKKVAKQREAERQAQEAQAKLRQLEEELSRIKQPQRPVVPPIPEVFDPEYDQKIAYRDQVMAAQFKYDADIAYAQQQHQYTLQQQQRAQQEALQQKVSSYSERAGKLGITSEELAAAGQKVALFGINDAIAQHILDDDMGPGITTYLAKNPQELEALGALDPLRAAVYLETKIKPKARPTPIKPPPEPIETFTGASVVSEGVLKGVRFE